MIHLKPEILAALNNAHADNNTDALKAAVGVAIQLEHSTIPPYLYALYSLKQDSNVEIQQLLQSIVVEEMLHLALDCNLLSALGGSPALDDPALLPGYPGSLPGTVENELIVHLEPFSLDLVQNTFMVIEEPENPLNFQTLDATSRLTIGEFYAALQQQIDAFTQSGRDIFVGNPAHQVTSSFFPASELFPITNAATAKQAIDLIVEQGEGTTQSPEDAQKEPAHYYRFAEIFHGRQLIPNPAAPPDAPPNQKFIYGGPPIPFDATGVLPVLSDPKAAAYPAGSQARYVCDTFNYTYTSLLKSLHLAFNGQPNQLNAGIGLMNSLREQALQLTAIDLGNGTNAGPSFEYQPVNP